MSSDWEQYKSLRKSAPAEAQAVFYEANAEFMNIWDSLPDEVFQQCRAEADSAVREISEITSRASDAFILSAQLYDEATEKTKALIEKLKSY